MRQRHKGGRAIRESALQFELHDFLLAGLSFFLCAAIILLKEWIPRLGGRSHDLYAVQAAHTHRTPRLGGVGIFGALALSMVFAPLTLSAPYQRFMLAVAVLFLVGLLEDLGFDISPLQRLFAAIAASLLTIVLLGVWLPRTDIPSLDAVIGHWAMGVPVTLLVTAGMANGFNLIDGVHGLASLSAIVAAIAMSLIAHEADYRGMEHLAMMVAAGAFGFLLLNYPLGLIFLGDAGAYTLGFVLSWFGISILLRVPDASPWAILLTLFWPAADTLLAIHRRLRRKTNALTPDRLHVHQLVMRALEVCFLGRRRRSIANPLTTLLLMPLVISPAVAGVLLWNESLKAFLAVLIFGALFFGSYAAAPSLIRRFRRQP